MSELQWPLSGAQSGIWFAQQRDPANPAYNTGEYIEIAGPIEAGRFEKAVRRAIAEAEALHVRFVEHDGAPRQVPDPVPDWPIEFADVSAEPEPRAAAEEWMRADLAQPVDLGRDPLFTQALFRTAPDRYLWYQRCHHVALDAYGYALIERRVAEIYTALAAGQPCPDGSFGSLESLLDEDRAYRESEDFVRDRAYWAEHLRGSAEPVSLADGTARPAARCLRETATLPAAQADQLTGLARRVKATWAEAVTAAIAAYLHRMTRSDDIVLGLPVMNRMGSAVLRVPGMVVNVVPLRLSFAPDTRAGDLIGQVTREMRAARKHQRYRAEDLRRDLNLVGDERRLYGPLVNIKPFGTDLSFAGHPARVHYIAPGPVEDLSISVYEEDGALAFVLDANPDCYDADALAEHRDRFLAFLAALCSGDPDQRVDDLPLLLPGERERLLPGAPGPSGEHAPDGPPATLPELFEAQVRRGPWAVALTQDGAEVTYAELNARANRLARLLLAEGAGPEQVVALALPRSIDMIVALLAVLKTGGAYLPLDPGLPAERIAFMLADAAPVLVLADAERAAALPCDSGVPVLALDAPEIGTRLAAFTASDLSDRDRPVPPRPDGLAYVIYTSGSTGRPKGVEIPHHNVVRLFGATDEWFGFGADDVWTLFHSYAFDFSVWEIWGALLHGGRLVIVPYEVTRSPDAFLRLLADEGVTVLNQTPSAFYELDRADRGDPATGRRLALRYVVFGGEALDPRRLADWYERHGAAGPALINMYGITETTVHVTYAPLDDTVTRGSGVIGRPIPDLRVYVLDEELCPVPPGVPGELYVAGAGLARGYRGRPELTAERFPPDPYGPPGTRMYRTGDRARWRRDGGLDYLGRTDQQVKIRGFRIEPGEIEAALTRRDDVAQAVVLAREDRPGDRRLVAYLVPAAGGAADPGPGVPAPGVPGQGDPSPGELRRDLAATLPGYMVPSAFVTVDALPLTANGKLDQDALPAPDPSAEARGRPARTPAEEILCGLFAEVLGLPSVGIDDGFFELGGHSLLATQLIGRIRTVLGVEPTIGTLFDAPTVAGLAARIHPRSDRPAPHAVPPAERPAEIPLSHAQRRLWFLHRMEKAGPEGPSPAYNIPLAVRLTGDLDLEALDAALGDLVTRHESLRTVFPEHDDTPYQRVLDPAEGRPVLEVTDTTADRLAAQLAAATRHGFDLARRPPLRAELFRLAPDEHVLLLLLHHIAGDEWSLTPLAADLSQAYRERHAGHAPSWAPPPLQYADYTIWQRELLGDEDDPGSLIARRLGFWTSELADLPDQLDLPTDRPRPAVATNRGGTVPVRIGGETYRRLRTLAHEGGASPFMVVQAALAGLLTRLGAGTDIPIGSPVAGRDDAALDGLVGFFVNTLVLRTDTSGDPTFRELLGRVRDADLAAYDNQDVPFERLVEVLNPARSLSRHPLFQVMLAYQHAYPASPEMPGLDVRREPVDVRTAKFDLTFILTELGDDGIEGVIEYSADLFDEATVASLADRLAAFLDAVTGAPDRPIGEPDILTPSERDEMIVRWNDTAQPVTAPPLPQMFEEQVARTPEAEALVADGRRFTYAEVDARANRLAHHLRGLGVGPECTVGIHLARSGGMVIGLLAVLKAGGAFVPLEPSWPRERIAGIGHDARLTAVLTTPQGRGDLPDLGIPAVELEPGWSAFDGHPATSPPPAVDPDNLAYVIYTSGSTGAPKGAMIRHEAISNRLPWQQGLLDMTPDDAVLHKAPLTFDISVNEIFLPLVTGARLVVAEPGTEGDVAHLLGLIARERVTFVYLVSSILDVMLERDDVATAGRSLRHVWCGGEVLTPELYARFRERLDATMYHGYGPAEATIGVTCQVYRGADPAEGITIGRPNPNTRAHVLDPGMRPVPVGVPGELYLGGIPLARGYLGDPARTAEKFVPDPFAAEPGARLYRSGDLARYRADGNIEFLGRADNQIKIRGVRVELEEIEAVATRHPGVRQAVVLADGATSATRLTAYCVPDAQRPATADELRDWLAARLPEYMVPRDIHLLPAFPLMTSGKVDRKALAARSAERDEAAAPAAPYVAPATGTEQVIADVWAELFDVERVGARDNFFDLGGHSLLLARVQAQLERRLGMAVSMLDLFSHPTVAALAARLGEVASGDVAGGTRDALRILLPLRTEGTRPPLFLVHPAAGLSWPFAGLRKHIDEGYPLYGIQARGLDEPRPVAGSIEEMAREYLEQVRTVQPAGPYHLVGWSFGGIVVHAMANLLQDEGEEVGLLGMLDAYPSYPWEKLADDHEQEALRSLLYMSHYDLDELGDEPLSRTRVMDIVREKGGILAELRESTISQIIDTFVNSAVLQRKAEHRRYDGDLLFFTATVDPIDPSLTAGMWRPHVGGTIENHDIACEHKDMTQPGPLAEIGGIINRKLQTD